MYSQYGIDRVLEPKHVLPTSAWKLDNSKHIHANEIRIAIDIIHLERTNFKEICLDSHHDQGKIKEKILNIVNTRGKLHNPITDTGGLFCGVVDEIGEDYDNVKNFQIGDKVICNASMASVPVHISEIKKINMAYGQIEVEGYAILYSGIPLISLPSDVPIDLLLYTFNESGTLYRISNSAIGKKKFLVVGNNLLSNLLFGFAIRKVAPEDAEVICLIDKKAELIMTGYEIEQLTKQIFTQVRRVDILKPLECIREIQGDALFDLSVNCADIPGAETINILATKSGGIVVFANLINNYNISLYITESISRQLDIRCADGYLEAYDQFDIELVKELAPYMAKAHLTSSVVDDPAYPLNRKEKASMELGRRTAAMQEFICESRAMADTLDEVMTVATYDCNVLITGETGVGKEKIANIIHKNSSRKMQNFVKVNCGSISPNLMESEFFGYSDGAFTGASKGGKEGYFQIADNGTLLLDEIGELPLDMQAKLLRVIQDGEFYPVGSTQPVRCNVRILAATNKDLERMVCQGQFRRDLYYRLNVALINVPSLKERTADIRPLVLHFIDKYSKKFHLVRDINDDAMEYMEGCEWPGNIRELENMVQRLMITARDRHITLMDVMSQVHSDVFGNKSFGLVESSVSEGFSLAHVVEGFEKNIIKKALEEYGTTRKAAKAIGVSQTQLVRKKNKYGL